MVDVSGKAVTEREARASGLVRMRPETRRLIADRALSKGDVLEVARLAGIQAAKRTDELIPLCHSVPLDAVEVGFEWDADDPGLLRVEARVRCHGRTGVEMEALTAVAVASLTIYDMCKSVDRELVIERVRLEEKHGGRSGSFRRDVTDQPGTLGGGQP
ncbi:MAG: cyclic pyranopterin monophosphate synthase accessory protein [Isosphaeraceae bacterium]|jgi:cyclic pyranopterin phosphate synthase|nr:MAG: cyclic pyranopterin monophosphate synthase accessory protein [Isosphaeraceae bacterium]